MKADGNRNKRAKKRTRATSDELQDDPIDRVAQILLGAFQRWFPAVYDVFGESSFWETEASVGTNTEEGSISMSKAASHTGHSRRSRFLNERNRMLAFENLREYEQSMHGRFVIAPEGTGAMKFIKQEAVDEDSVTADDRLWRVVDARLMYTQNCLIKFARERLEECMLELAELEQELKAYEEQFGISWEEIKATKRDNVDG